MSNIMMTIRRTYQIISPCSQYQLKEKNKLNKIYNLTLSLEHLEEVETPNILETINVEMFFNCT